MLSSHFEDFLCIAVSTADATTVNPGGIKIFLANGFSIFFIKIEADFSKNLEIFIRNTPDCTTLDS